MTLMCIDRSQSPTHKGNFLQSGKSTVSNINQHNANHHRRNSCSPPLSSKTNCNNNNNNHLQNELSSPAKSPTNSSDCSRKLDRSCSEPDRRVVQSNSSRYKTELCRPYEENGVCKYGDKCQFAHGSKELRSMARHPKYKTELCRTFHSTGLCPYGPRCHFIHNSEQTKKTLMTNLTGTSPPPTTSSTRPKALTSLGSAGDVSPTSSQGGSPTEMRTFFADMSQNPLSPGPNNVFLSPEELQKQFQAFVNLTYYEYKSEADDAINGFNDKLMMADVVVDNYRFQRETFLDLNPVNEPMTPTTPLDASPFGIRLPIFDCFPKQ